jgi:hypothetical protein
MPSVGNCGAYSWGSGAEGDRQTMTRIIAKVEGKATEHDLPEQPLTVVVHDPSIKIEVPEVPLVDIKATTQCMEQMSQRAWEHISTGPLFQHLFNALFQDREVRLPPTISTLLADYDEGVIHACGLIILLVEARLAGKRKMFVKNPETHLHPATQRRIVDVLRMIQSIPGDGDMVLECAPT